VRSTRIRNILIINKNAADREAKSGQADSALISVKPLAESEVK
jgi:hypothetical protein